MEMRKAYDTFLQSEVSADLAGKSGGLSHTVTNALIVVKKSVSLQ